MNCCFRWRKSEDFLKTEIRSKKNVGEWAVGLTLQRVTVHPPCHSRLRSPTDGALDVHVWANHAELTLRLRHPLWRFCTDTDSMTLSMWKAHQQHGQTRKGEENIALYWSYHSDFSALPSAHRTPPLLSIIVLGHVYYCISYSFEIVVIWSLHYHYKSILKLLSSSVSSVLVWMSSLCSCPCSVILVSCFNLSRLILVFPLLICQIGMFFALSHHFMLV